MLDLPMRLTRMNDLDQVVEPGRRVILDRGCAHDELAPRDLRSAEVPVVLGPGVVEVGEVAAVVDDALRIRVREPDAGRAPST